MPFLLFLEVFVCAAGESDFMAVHLSSNLYQSHKRLTLEIKRYRMEHAVVNQSYFVNKKCLLEQAFGPHLNKMHTLLVILKRPLGNSHTDRTHLCTSPKVHRVYFIKTDMLVLQPNN